MAIPWSWQGRTVQAASPKAVPAVIRNDYFVIVTVQPGDTLASLAKTYLGDAGRSWQIAGFNQISTAVEGRRIVIPLKHPNPGGIQADGYQTVPVLLYRNIVTHTPKAYELSTQAFESQMKYLKDMGYSTISLDQLTRFLNLQDSLPEKAIVITFDSAHRWVYDTAYPVLKRLGLTAAIFISTDEIEKSRRLKWQELAQLAAEGFDIGTSGANAGNLVKPRPGSDSAQYLERIEDEITGAKAAINKKLKKECRYFAYPGGETDDYIIALLKKYQFEAAFTLQRGSNPFYADNFRINRSIIGVKNEKMQFRQNLKTFTTTELK